MERRRGKALSLHLSCSCHLLPPALRGPAPAACPFGRQDWCLWNFLISSPGYTAAFHQLPSGVDCVIRSPGSSTHLECSDITVVCARINRAWQRAARSYPRANTALCQIGDCFCRGSVCAWWVGGKFHQDPGPFTPPPDADIFSDQPCTGATW